MAAIKTYKPTTNGRRNMTVLSFEEITTNTPEKSLLAPVKKNAGRNNTGRITVRHQGGGAKQKYRIIDFKRNKDDVPGKVATIEYDPNRNANIALINYLDGEKRYIIAPKDLKVGMIVESGEVCDIKVGNAMKLKNIPMGTTVHCIELKPGKGGQIARSAGCYAQLIGKDSGYVQVRLNSGELRMVRGECFASVGAVSNPDNQNTVMAKAGRARWNDHRPAVRGIAMNPVDHPHGGRTNGGRHPVSPWGWQTKGKKTRNNKRTDGLIIRSRHAAKKS